jgi:acyl-CoA synthetase (AMP-forming)/AMP-acid ligase II/3-hydroxymyristoyl/3-hydroxydecanoyl-(acyl carrier protein) dehydratase
MSDFFLELAARAPASIIGWRGAQAVRQADLLARVSAWRALALRTPGLSAALFIEDSLEFSAALLGAWQAGKTVWLSADTLDASCTALAGSVDAFFGAFPASCNPLAPAPGEACALAWRALDADAPALVVHTSGSTGTPQAIPKRLVQLTSEVATLEALFGARLGSAAIVATVSHQHIYGLLFKVLWPLAAGRPIHAHSVNYPEQLAALMGGGPCVLVASPAHLKRLPGHLDWRAAALCLRAVFSSGGPLDPETAAGAGALLGHVPTEIYGSSETGGIGWRQRTPGAAGAWQAMPDVAWRVAYEGLLEVRSPHLGADGWLRLADRVQAVGETDFMLLGRSDRIVKIEEKRVSLDALEAALVRSPLVREARVIVAGGAARQRQSLAAFVVTTEQGQGLLAADGKHALNRALRAELAGAVEAVALPRRWRYLDRLPLDAQGKTTHTQLLALLGEDERPRLPLIALQELDEGRALFELTVPASLFYFDGHFAQAPLLPGVVQLDWAILYGRRYFPLAPSFQAIHALKFQHMIRPDVPVMLELQYDAQKSILSFRYFSAAGQHSGGRIQFGPFAKNPC